MVGLNWLRMSNVRFFLSLCYLSKKFRALSGVVCSLADFGGAGEWVTVWMAREFVRSDMALAKLSCLSRLWLTVSYAFEAWVKNWSLAKFYLGGGATVCCFFKLDVSLSTCSTCTLLRSAMSSGKCLCDSLRMKLFFLMAFGLRQRWAASCSCFGKCTFCTQLAFLAVFCCELIV